MRQRWFTGVCVFLLLASVGGRMSAAAPTDFLSALPAIPEAAASAAEQRAFQAGIEAMVLRRREAAIQRLRPLAEKGMTEAQAALGLLYEQGDGPDTRREALKWSYYAAQGGDSHAGTVVGRAYMDGRWVSRDLRKARKWLQQAESQGDEEAAELLARLDRQALEEGKTALDKGRLDEARSLLVPVADRGIAEAQFQAGRIEEQSGNRNAARDWYSRAADQGMREAKYRLGVLLMEEGKKADAAAMLEEAGEPGIADAQYRLGMLYLQGDGVERDDAKAMQWYRIAGEQGHAEAQYTLGVRYSLGKGAEQDVNEAARWFRRSGEQGHARAQHNLGMMYLSGVGTEQDIGKAKEWLGKAARQGVTKSQYHLGRIYVSTAKDKNDRLEGIRWLKEAARRDSGEAVALLQQLGEKAPPPATAVKAAASAGGPATRKSAPKKNADSLCRQGGEWFNGLQDGRYTIQLLAGSNPQGITDFIRVHRLGKEYAHCISRDGRKWNVLLYGEYAGFTQAARAIRRMPASMRANNPWVRRVRSVRQRLAQ